MARVPSTWCAAVAAILLSLAAHADDASKKAAYELNKQSAERYREGQFKEAAELLRKAYAIEPDPVLLYNLGRACEGMGDDPCAIDAYERYLAAASPPDRGAIEKKISIMRARAAPPPPSAPPPPRELPRPPSAWPWVTAGVGVATFATGATLAFVARARHDDAVADPEQASAARTQASAEATMRSANVLLLVGGIVATTGITWLILDRSSKKPATVSAGPSSVWLTVAF